jgi:hypothetical protein
MQAKWGIAWLVTAFWLAVFLGAPASGLAADFALKPLPLLAASAQNSLEAQMLGEQPQKPATPNFPGMSSGSSLQLHHEGGDANLKLPFNTELNISIRYNREPNPVEPQSLANSPLYMKYAVDYRLFPNLRVGLNSYLYRPSEEGFPFQRPLGNQLIGMGSQLKYDLGNWSFLLKSQMESGNRNPGQGKDLQNWLRVWYAF